jgi:ATP-binding cassette subfamily F protein 3
VERFRASATRSTQAKSREKQLEKITRIEVPEQDKRRMVLRFPPPQPSGRQVLTLRNVAKSFGDKRLFRKLSANLERNQRVFLLGANGTGKTTLLRLILGQEALDEGEIRPGHNVALGYFSQNQLESLEPTLSVFDTLQQACPQLTQTEVRSLLGRFLFTGDQVFKPVSVLSGGEKSKLALARLMMSGPNTLLLDEPTNHMDISAKEVMSEALLAYEGTVLCISHDRYFIQELATDIWELYEGHLLTYCGDYDYYLRKREEMRATVTQVPPAFASRDAEPSASAAALPGKAASPLKARKELEKELNRVEKSIMALESEIADLEVHLQAPEIQQDYARLQALSATIGDKQQTLTQLNAQWESLADALGT